jgi:hypothetical protein
MNEQIEIGGKVVTNEQWQELERGLQHAAEVGWQMILDRRAAEEAANTQTAEQHRVEDALIDAQHAEIDADVEDGYTEVGLHIPEDDAAIAMQPEMIRQHETRGLVDVGTRGAYKVWYAIGARGQTWATASYSEAIRLMERALADGAGVVTIERAYGFVWTQEVWALVGEVC